MFPDIFYPIALSFIEPFILIYFYFIGLNGVYFVTKWLVHGEKKKTKYSEVLRWYMQKIHSNKVF